jgi:hypothetical protein
MHCHTTHHVMNQMGHEAPNMVGVNPGPLDRKVAGLLPGYMTMGHNGMGGMFTIVKIREHLDSYGDRGGTSIHPARSPRRRASPNWAATGSTRQDDSLRPIWR